VVIHPQLRVEAELLGEDDLIVNKLQIAMSVYQNVLDDITNFKAC
jgi:hypothetical protein